MDSIKHTVELIILYIYQLSPPIPILSVIIFIMIRIVNNINSFFIYLLSSHAGPFKKKITPNMLNAIQENSCGYVKFSDRKKLFIIVPTPSDMKPAKYDEELLSFAISAVNFKEIYKIIPFNIHARRGIQWLGFNCFNGVNKSYINGIVIIKNMTMYEPFAKVICFEEKFFVPIFTVNALNTIIVVINIPARKDVSVILFPFVFLAIIFLLLIFFNIFYDFYF